MGIQAIVSFGVGLTGLGLGVLGLVLGSDALSIVLSILVIGLASASIWLGWALLRDGGQRHHRARSHRRYGSSA